MGNMCAGDERHDKVEKLKAMKAKAMKEGRRPSITMEVEGDVYDVPITARSKLKSEEEKRKKEGVDLFVISVVGLI